MVALRDYYGLKSSAPAPDAASNDSSSRIDEVHETSNSELNAEGFDAEAYVRTLLSTQGLAGVLKA